MKEIFDFLVFLFAAYLIWQLFYYTLKRLRAVISIRSLKKECRATVKFLRMPYLSYFKLSASPDAVVEVGEKVYLIRFINGKGGLRSLHFASDEYFVTYSRLKISVAQLFSLARGRQYSEAASTARRSVKILPRLRIPKKYTSSPEYYGKTVVPVLIFSPTPCEVTYVTKEKTSVKVAFSGDLVYGNRIFTPDSFVSYVGREMREEEYRRQNKLQWR